MTPSHTPPTTGGATGMSRGPRDTSASRGNGTHRPFRYGRRMLWGDVRVRRGVLGLMTGAAAASLALLPWAVTGMRLPLQNLWADPAASPSTMPVALLPFSQYHVALIAALVLVGSAAAAVAVRLLGPRLARAGRWSALAGVLLVQWVALLQTTVVTEAGLRNDSGHGAVLRGGADASELYLTALVVGTAAATALGVAVFVALTSASAPAALVALAVAAIALGSWCNGLVVGVAGVGDETTTTLVRGTRWLPAVALGLGIAASRLRTLGSVIGATVAVVVVWVGTAAVTAVSSALGSRVMLARPHELADYGVEVFRAALRPAGDGLTLAAAAAAIGLVGAALAAVVLRRRPAPDPA